LSDVSGSQAGLARDDAATPPSSSALLLRARAGDAAAREELARTSGDAAFRFALQLLGDRELARDVAQDSVLRLFATLRRSTPIVRCSRGSSASCATG
jgi:hypothetical protein